MKYKRLNDRLKELYNQIEEINEICFINSNLAKELEDVKTECLIEHDCLCHFFECEGYKIYESISNFCLTNNINKVYDIGCAYGHQSEIFLNDDITYVGIDNYGSRHFWNEDQFEFLNGTYPFSLESFVSDNDLAISVLCLTWNCYLYEGEKTLNEQLAQLSRDFNHCILFLSIDKIDDVMCYFKYSEKIDNNYNIYYFKN